jgi:hypothetical protein
MADKPMTKTEARAFLRRAREALRDAEAALRDNNVDDLNDALNEVTGSAAHLQGAIDPDYDGHGIAGVGTLSCPHATHLNVTPGTDA